MTDGKLTPKQTVFVLAYIGEARFNATRAAEIAGYKDPMRYGSDLRRNPEIAARIDEELNIRSLKASEVLAELTDVATAEWRDFVEILARNEDGEPIRVRMDLSSKIKSLELLGKNHKLFTDNLNLNGDLTQRIELIGVDAGDI